MNPKYRLSDLEFRTNRLENRFEKQDKIMGFFKKFLAIGILLTISIVSLVFIVYTKSDYDGTLANAVGETMILLIVASSIIASFIWAIVTLLDS